MRNSRECPLTLTPESDVFLGKLSAILAGIDVAKVRAVGRATENTPGCLQVLGPALRNLTQMGNAKASLKADSACGCFTIEVGFGFIAHVWTRAANGELFGTDGSVLQIDHRRDPIRMSPDAQAALKCIEGVLGDPRVRLRGVGLDVNGKIIRLPDPRNLGGLSGCEFELPHIIKGQAETPSQAAANSIPALDAFRRPGKPLYEANPAKPCRQRSNALANTYETDAPTDAPECSYTATPEEEETWDQLIEDPMSSPVSWADGPQMDEL
jgi:hypothetical protein